MARASIFAPSAEGCCDCHCEATRVERSEPIDKRRRNAITKAISHLEWARFSPNIYFKILPNTRRNVSVNNEDRTTKKNFFVFLSTLGINPIKTEWITRISHTNKITDGIIHTSPMTFRLFTKYWRRVKSSMLETSFHWYVSGLPNCLRQEIAVGDFLSILKVAVRYQIVDSGKRNRW